MAIGLKEDYKESSSDILNVDAAPIGTTRGEAYLVGLTHKKQCLNPMTYCFYYLGENPSPRKHDVHHTTEFHCARST
jgi:hypothetical protein